MLRPLWAHLAGPHAAAVDQLYNHTFCSCHMHLVFVAAQVLNDEGEILALKMHRLGRTSFRAVKSKRDYLQHRTSFRWVALQDQR